MQAARFRDRIAALLAVVQALALVVAAAELVIQLSRQHPLGVLGGTVDQIHLLALHVAGVVFGEVRHAIDVNEVGGGDEALDLVHPLAAPLGVNIQQVRDL